jgi:hypothetical protein
MEAVARARGEPPSGCPTSDEIKGAYERAALHNALMREEEAEDQTAKQPPAQAAAVGGISIVSRLIEGLRSTVSTAADPPVLEYSKDIPIFTFSHESRLLTECYAFSLPNGAEAKMLPCARGNNCTGTSPLLQGHEESGGIVLRALLTPEELTAFEHTGVNPPAPRLCVMCARVYVAEAYFEAHDARHERLVRGACFNYYGNLRGCRDGYKVEHTIPLDSGTRWNGLVAPVACNSLSRMRVRKQAGIWSIDQRELAFVEPHNPAPNDGDDLRRFR